MPGWWITDNRRNETVKVEKDPLAPVSFISMFRTVLQDWEEERLIDSSMPSAMKMTKALWGNCNGWSPYCDLSLVAHVTPDKIIHAIKGYIGEFHNRDAWLVMDEWVRKMGVTAKSQFPDIYEILDTFESVIYNDARPDLDYDD